MGSSGQREGICHRDDALGIVHPRIQYKNVIVHDKLRNLPSDSAQSRISRHIFLREDSTPSSPAPAANRLTPWRTGVCFVGALTGVSEVFKTLQDDLGFRSLFCFLVPAFFGDLPDC